MSSRNLIIVIATIVVVVAAWKTSQQNAPETELIADRLYPELIDALNDISRVSIKTVDNSTELARLDNQWVVANRDNFPAEFSAVKSALINLAEVIVIEQKTSKPENYPKIGVAGIEHEGSGSLLVQIEGTSGSELASILIGNERSGNNLPAPNFYVRKLNEDAALLVEGDLDFADDPNDWMTTDIANVAAKRVQKITINRTDETPIIASKASQMETVLSLEGIPTGSVVTSRSSISAFGGLLLNLKFENVAAAAKVAGLAPRTIAEVQTFDGMVATLEQFDYQEDVYIRFRFAFNPDIVIAPLVVPEALAATLETLNKTEGSAPVKAAEEVSVEDEVAALNTKVSNWVYALPDHKIRLLDKKFDDLIKPEEAEKKPAEAATSK
jgi:hypothetical protein